MLLIPFIENSFKHGLQGGPGESLVFVHIQIGHRETLEFRSRNSGEITTRMFDNRKGIGIENTRQRLGIALSGQTHA